MAHRDVKPGNILMDERGTPILTDFGIARIVASSRLTQEGVSTGTPAYMSPEQAGGMAGDMRSDLYSLGVILFELLAGRPPYEDEGGLSLILKHINAPVPPISQYLPKPNPTLDAFILRALAKNPEDRFQSAAEFADQLIDAFISTGLVASAPSIRATATTPVVQVRTTTSAQAVSPVTPTPTVLPLPSTPARRVPVLAIIALAATAIVAAALVVNRLPPAPLELEAANSTSPTVEATPVRGPFFTTLFSADDDYLDDWPQGEIGVVTAEVSTDGFYHLRNNRPRTAATAIFNPQYTYGSISISMAGALSEASDQASAYGIVFNYLDEDHYNVFAIDGLGRFSVWVRSDGQWRELRNAGENWTRNEAINLRGEANALLLDVLGGNITAYVNGTEVARTRDTTYRSGNIGIYLASDVQGVVEVKVDSYQTFPAAPPSMTGG
jgi:hypothetical protein